MVKDRNWRGCRTPWSVKSETRDLCEVWKVLDSSSSDYCNVDRLWKELVRTKLVDSGS